MARKRGIDWTKVALIGGGAFAVLWALKPKRAQAAVIPPSTVRAAKKAADASGRDIQDVLNDLALETRRRDPTSIVIVPKVIRLDGSCRDLTVNRGRTPVPEALCQRCDSFSERVDDYTEARFRRDPDYFACFFQE